MEALFNLYEDSIEPHTCPNPKCKHIINPRPHRAVLRAFLKEYGLQDKKDIVMQFYNIRGDLFHEGKSLKEATSSQPKLQEILKQSILKTLNNNVAS
jgi:hypothetical protein